MGYSRQEHPYSGGAQTFPVNFALGVLEQDDVRVYVIGEVDGFGDQLYRTFTWVDAGNLLVTDALPNPSTVVVERTVDKDQINIDVSATGPVTRVTLVNAFKQLMMNIHELLDGRVDSFSGAILDGLTGVQAATQVEREQAEIARAGAEDARTAAETAQTAAEAAQAAAEGATEFVPTDYYTRAVLDAALADKADSADVYTTDQLYTKAEVYTQSEVDAVTAAVSAAIPAKVTEPEAKSGTNNEKFMTALRTADAIEAQRKCAPDVLVLADAATTQGLIPLPAPARNTVGASVSVDTVTLPAGSYWIEAVAPVRRASAGGTTQTASVGLVVDGVVVRSSGTRTNSIEGGVYGCIGWFVTSASSITVALDFRRDSSDFVNTLAASTEHTGTPPNELRIWKS